MVTDNYLTGRMADRTYYMLLSDDSLSKFQVKKRVDAETAFYVAKQAMTLYEKALEKNHDKKFRDIRFSYGGKHWKLIQPQHSRWYYPLLNIFQVLIFHKPSPSASKEFKIERAYFGPGQKFNKTTKAKRAQWKQNIKRRRDLDNYHSLKLNSSPIEKISSLEYVQGIRAKMVLSESQDRYEDPFTRLASLAFQKYEPFHSSKDGSTVLSSRYRIIKLEETLLLVHVNSPLATEENLKEAAVCYASYLEKVYGEEKITYIDYLYKMELKDSLELTPEHVFRINTGTTNLEMQDIKRGIEQLTVLSLEDVLDVDTEMSFIDWAKNKIPLNIAIGVNRQLTEPTVQNFLDWMEEEKSMADWIPFFQLSQKDIDQSATGRKIMSVIQGSYASGEWVDFKPWIDQQELTQLFSVLTESSSFESYLEQLSHNVVKKHLARRHPSDILRVGALIPAPPEERGGPIRFYHVTSCSTNQYSYSYTLESACEDASLPSIKLYRNTASSAYAIYSSKTIVNDFSLLNPPGYMGMNQVDEREKAFFQDRTIPVWVGYQYLAQEKINEKGDFAEIYSLLENANKALRKELKSSIKFLSFCDVLKKHDIILNELYYRNKKITGFQGKKLSPLFLKIFNHIIKKYIQVNRAEYNKIPQTTIFSDAKKLEAVLLTLLEDEEGSREQLLITELINDLHFYILDPDGEEIRESSLQSLLLEELTPLNNLKNGAKESKEIEDLQKWSDTLRQLAEVKNENVDSKIAVDLAFVGQSLGGACAQIAVAYNLTNPNRVPLPGHSCSLVEFDAPAINEIDNERFKSFGNRNKQLLKDLDIQFKIFRRQEAGDIIPSVGEEHLGAVFSLDEHVELKGWVEFDAALNRRMKLAKRREIAEAVLVHETLFLEGVAAPGRIRLNERRALSVTIPPKNQEADYRELKYDAHIQGIFDSHAKKGEISGKKGRKAYNKMYKDVWMLPHLRVLNEKLRKSTDTVACYIRKQAFINRAEDKRFPKKSHDFYGRVYVGY